jgi:hypothetical protein
MTTTLRVLSIGSPESCDAEGVCAAVFCLRKGFGLRW